MTTPELPPLPPEISSLPRYAREEIARRERILLARIAELESLWQSAEARYAEADAAAMAHAKRIAELEADAERYRWLRDKSPGHWTLQVGDLPLFKGDVDAAIDAARGAKP